jgi:hypothetical protein
MRITHLIFTGSIAALAALTAPAQAKNSNTPEINDTSASSQASSNCHAYQQAPDGSWNPVACEELGAPSTPAQTHHKSASQSSNQDMR